MDGEDVKKFHSQGSTFVGAILMSNHATKQECLQRKLFGLPSSKSRFVMQIKAGMLLFLFEHEERKLYGVFEATSDGAMNIEPNAFLSSGNSFPAQVLFKRIWMCKPLSEDEFSDAIKENYFAPNKFNFGLSYDQVFKLVELFNLKRINVKQYQRPGIPNEIIKLFEKRAGNKVKVTGQTGSAKFDADEYSRDDGRDSQRHLGLSRPNTNSSMSYQKLTRKQPSFVNNGRRWYQMPRHTTEACPPRWSHYESKPPHLTCPTSPNDPSSNRNFPERPMYGHHGYHGFPGSGGDCSSTLHMDCPSLPQEPSHIGSSMDMQPHQFNSPLRPSHTGLNALHFHPPNLIGSSIPICNPSNVSLPPIHSDGRLNFHDYKHVSHTERYDPSNPRFLFSPGMHMAKRTETSPSVHPSNSHGYPEGSRQEFESEEQPCGGIGPPPDYIPLPVSNCFNKNVGSSHLKSPRKDTSIKYSSEYIEDDDSQGMGPYPAAHAEEYYPTVVKSRLHSDTEQSRTSVFSRLTKASDTRRLSQISEASRLSKTLKARRLSKTPEARRLSKIPVARRLSKTPEASRLSKTPEALSKSQEAFQKHVSQEPVTSLSLDQLEAILSQRREQLIEVTKVPKQSSIPDDEKFESTAAAEPSKVICPEELEVSNDAVVEDAIAEENSEHLFLNFKRRSEIRRLSGENELDVHSDSGLDEGSPQYKRRKFLRPSFSEEECQDVQGSNREIVGVETVVENSEKNIKNSKLSPSNHLDVDNKNSSASEASLPAVASDKTINSSEGLLNTQLDGENKNSSVSKGGLGDVASYKTENSSGSSTTRRKEVSNRNLLWFLQKSVDQHANTSNVDHVNEKTKDQSHVISEVSVLPANSKHGDKEIPEENVASFVDQKKY